MRLNVGDKPKIHLVSSLTLLGFTVLKEEKERAKRKKRRKKEEEEKKIKVWNPYFWVFDMNPKVFGRRIVAPLV